MSDDELPELGARIRAAAMSAAAAKAVYDDDLAARNRLILEALDKGYQWRQVSAWSGLSMERLRQLIVASAASS